VAAAIKAVMAEYLFADLPDPDVDPTSDETDPEPV
jgi:hypothetical protein